MNPYQVVKDFESALCEYTGAPFCVVTTSCTMALLLACKWHNVQEVSIPSKTYVGVAMSIKNAGGTINWWHDYDWHGTYKLDPYPIWDCARRFTKDMYKPSQYQCLSFHWSKILSIGQGGAILHDHPEADKWFRKARYDGRTEGVHPKDDKFIMGYHAYMMPRDAAEGLSRLSLLPDVNADLPNDDYADLSKADCFQ